VQPTMQFPPLIPQSSFSAKKILLFSRKKFVLFFPAFNFPLLLWPNNSLFPHILFRANVYRPREEHLKLKGSRTGYIPGFLSSIHPVSSSHVAIRSYCLIKQCGVVFSAQGPGSVLMISINPCASVS
jgi:hypothetical protein